MSKNLKMKMSVPPLIRELKKGGEVDYTKKKIVFSVIEAGEGHKSPAQAVKEALEQISPGQYEMIVTDFMKDTGCVSLDSFHKKTWNYLLAHPTLCKSVQRIADITGPVFRALLKIIGSSFYKYVLHFLERYKPDLIFSTHPFNTMAIEHVRKKYGIRVILVNYLTELFDIWSLWVLKNVDYYIVSSNESKEKLICRGVPRDKLYVFNYPTKLDFFDVPSSKEQIVMKLGINPSKKTLLISFGGQGCKKPFKFIDILVKNNIPLNVIIVTGKNKSMYTSLMERYKNYRGNLKIIVLGYVNNMDELIYISDFCFIKPGPSTIMEVISLKKPMLLSRSVHVGENANIDFVLKHRLGIYVGDSVNKFINAINCLVFGSYAEVVSKNYENIKTKNGAFDIAKFIIRIIERGD